MDDVAAAADAMRAQAKSWDELAETVTTVRARLTDLTLHADAFSLEKQATSLGKHATGFAEAYAERSERLVAQLGRAGKEFDRMARDLRAAADAYDEGDRAAADRLGSVW
ncbi:hypothetical protein ACIA5D_04010 [Actinoplanes sp. NPDC051513]|uniref:hypothetical protein n=1 Tax=Actinoplanes sp. NPDC051513 TaxID=3363908 RepID=UPI0037A40373